MKTGTKIILLTALGFFLSVAPMAIPIIMNLSSYEGDALKIPALVVFVCLLVALCAVKDKAQGFFKSNSQLKLTIILLAFIELTRYIFAELKTLLIFAVIGAVLALIPQYFVAKLKRRLDKEETAAINADALYGKFGGRV